MTPITERTLIVVKTRRGASACIGGITQSGRSVRLEHPSGPFAPEHRDFNVGDLWEVTYAPRPDPLVPHTETVTYSSRSRIKFEDPINPIQFIEERMPPVEGGVEALFDGLLNRHPTGALYINAATGVPAYSTTFWKPAAPLELVAEGAKMRYRIGEGGKRTSLVYVGFDAPLPTLEAGMLLNVSLAHWWRPQDKLEVEERCYVQLSGWFGNLEPANFQMFVEGLPTVFDDGGDASLAATSLATLERVFGFPEFLPLQEEAITANLQGKEALVILPTGAGKSLCYQLPAILQDGLTVVVSPLISLMQDQVEQLRALDVPAVMLHSDLPYGELERNHSQIRDGQAKIVYLAPERLNDRNLLMLLAQSRLRCIAVDEAHCISEWGHEFREDYRMLGALRGHFPNANWIALTATATPKVQEDIRVSLGMRDPRTLIGSFDRPNLFLRAAIRTDVKSQLLEMITEHREQAGIIYCRTRNQVDEYAAWLQEEDICALPYHAGLDSHVRAENQRRFIHGDVDVMVATVAFGMGINKPDVRYVIHTQPPDNLESYYQQIGRAGRDGLRADCLLLYAYADFAQQKNLIKNNPPKNLDNALELASRMQAWVTSVKCRRYGLLLYFGEADLPDSCTMCDRCVVEQGTDDLTVLAQKFLSCILRLQQRFGESHVIDVLRGSQSARITKLGHDKLSTHGIGKEYTREQWKHLSEQFQQLELITKDEFKALKLLPRGNEVLKGAAVWGTFPAGKPQGKSQSGAAVLVASPHPELVERLRTLRRKLAQDEGVPPYIIFGDRSLQEMAMYLPRDESQLHAIHGVGEFKVRKYGEPILAEIAGYCEEMGIQTKQDNSVGAPLPLPTQKPNKKPVRKTVSETVNMSAQLFNTGMSIAQIAEHRGLQPRTIATHLFRFATDGFALNVSQLRAEISLSPEEQEQVLEQFRILGGKQLNPIYQHFEGRISYDELHIFGLIYMQQPDIPEDTHDA